MHGKFERLPSNAALIPANGRGKHHSKQLIKKRKVMYLCTSRDNSQIEVVMSCYGVGRKEYTYTFANLLLGSGHPWHPTNSFHGGNCENST